MNLRAKWIVCAIVFVVLLGLGAWLNGNLPEHRQHRIMSSPAAGADKPVKSFNQAEEEGVGLLWERYLPREYVRIVHREQ